MMTRNPEPLNPDIEALLRVERGPIGQSELVRARAFARMRTALADPSLGAPHFRLATARFVWPAAAVVVFGAVAAAAVRIEHRLVAPAAVTAPTVRTSNVSSPIQPAFRAQAVASAGASFIAEASVPFAGSGAQARRVAARATDTKAVASAPSASTAFSSENYAEELALLQPARAALARGDFAAALQAIADHKRQFPSGLLGEERDALRARALSGMHRNDEARRAAAVFRRNYPRSVFLKSLEPRQEAVP